MCSPHLFLTSHSSEFSNFELILHQNHHHQFLESQSRTYFYWVAILASSHSSRGLCVIVSSSRKASQVGASAKVFAWQFGKRAKLVLSSFPDPRSRSRLDYRSERVTPLHVHAARAWTTRQSVVDATRKYFSRMHAEQTVLFTCYILLSRHYRLVICVKVTVTFCCTDSLL